MFKKTLALIVAIMMIWAMGLPAMAAGNPFADVPANHWAYDILVKLAELGIVTGYPEDGLFRGNRSLTRYEAAVMMARFLAVLEKEVASQVGAASDSIKTKAVEEAIGKAQAEVKAQLEAALANQQSALAKQIDASVEAKVKEAVKVSVSKDDKGQTVVEKVIVEKPVQTTVEVERPFKMTSEAEAAIAKLVTKQVADELGKAKLDSQVEKAVQAKVDSQIEKAVQAKVDEKLKGLRATDSGKVVGLTQSEVQALIDEQRAAIREQLLSDAQEIADAAVAEKLVALTNDLDARFAATDDSIVAAQSTADAAKSDAAANQAALAAVKGDVEALKKLLEGRSSELGDDVAKLAAELETELAVIGVRVSQLEYLFSKLEPRVAALEEGQKKTQEDVNNLQSDLEMAKVEVEATQRELASTKNQLNSTKAELEATKKDVAAAKDEQAKAREIKFSGSTAIEFDQKSFSGTSPFWKDPRKHDFDGDGVVGDVDDVYVRNDWFVHKLNLNMEVHPADNVTVKAGLAAVTNVFGAGSLLGPNADGPLDVRGLTLDVTTPGTVRSLHFGPNAEGTVADRFNKYTLHTDRLGDYAHQNEGVIASIVTDKLDSKVAIIRQASNKYLLGVSSTLPVNDSLTLTANYVRAQSLPNTALTPVVAARTQTVSLAANGKLGAIEYGVLTAFGAVGRSALDLNASTKLGNLGLKYTLGSVSKDWYVAPLYAGKNLNAYHGDILPDQTKRTVRADMPLLGVKAYAEMVNNQTAVSTGAFTNSTRLGFTELKLLGANVEAYTKTSTDQVSTVTNENYGKAGFSLLGTNLTGQTYNRSVNSTTDMSAVRIDGSRNVQVIFPLTVSGMYARNSQVAGFAAVKGSVALVGYKLSNNLTVDSSYSVTANEITQDAWMRSNGDWTRNDTRTLSAGMDYGFSLFNTALTFGYGYELKTYNGDVKTPLNKYTITAKRALYGADLSAKYVLTTGGWTGAGDGTYNDDTVSDFSLSYPVTSAASISVNAKYINSAQAENSGENAYKGYVLNAGLSFSF